MVTVANSADGDRPAGNGHSDSSKSAGTEFRGYRVPATSVRLPVGLTRIQVTVIVTAGWTTTRTYVIVITRQARVLETNADLDMLTLSGATLSPPIVRRRKTEQTTPPSQMPSDDDDVDGGGVPDGLRRAPVTNTQRATVKYRLNGGEYAAVDLTPIRAGRNRDDAT